MSHASRARRPRFLPPLVAALALVVAACGTGPDPSPVVSATPSAGPSSSAPGEAACTADQLEATGDRWEPAAGSRGATVVIRNEGADPCLLPPAPLVALVDASGLPRLQSATVTGQTGPSLVPGMTSSFTVLASNWCDESTPLPLRLVVRLDAGSVEVTGLALTADDLPPCNGPDRPATLTASDWQ